MNEYKTIFEYQPSGFDISPYISIMAFILFGFSIFFFTKKAFRSFSLLKQYTVFFGYALSGISTIFLIILLIGTPKKIKAHKDLKNLIDSKSYNIIEGVTKDFSPMPDGGHKMETFSVSGVKFEYSDYVIITGFHQTSKSGGPITGNDQKVRISYTTIDNQNLILKIESKQ